MDPVASHKCDTRRVEQREGEIKRLVELAARVGDLEHVATEIEARRAELEEIKERMTTGISEIDPLRLQTDIESAIGDMRGLLC